jgi:hypothetical protein
MKKILIAIAYSLTLSVPLFAQSPTLLQVKNDLDWVPSSFSSGGISSGDTISDQLPNSVGANNTVFELIAVDDTTSYPTITDHLGLTWTRNATCKDTTNGEDVLIYSAPTGANSGLDLVTTTFHASTQFTGAYALAEFAFVGSIDGAAACAFANSATVAAGSHTPSQSGDLVLQFSWNDWLAVSNGACIGVHYTHGSQANISWQKFIDGHDWCFGAQWGVYNSASALNPTFTVSSAGFNTAAVFFTPSASGTAQPSGVRIVAQANVPIMASGSFATNPANDYFPCPPSADTMVAEWAGPGPSSTYDLSSVTDSASNTWNSNHAEECDSGGNTCVHTYRADGATISDAQEVTLNLKATSDDTVHLFCLSGAASSSLDATAVNSGNQTTVGNQTLLTINPITANDLVLLVGSQIYNTTRSFTGTGQNYVGCFLSSENLDLDGCAANNPWGAYYNSGAGVVTWTAVFQSGTEATAQWSAEADAYKPATAPTAPPAPATSLFGEAR